MTDKNIAELGPIAEAIKRAGEERGAQGAKKLYVIFHSEYMIDACGASDFHGTYRELLLSLNDIDPEDMEMMQPFKVINNNRDTWYEMALAFVPKGASWSKIDGGPRHGYEFFESQDGETVYAEWNNRTGYLNKPNKDFTNEELKELFDNANGDGQPYYLVWCVEDRRIVIGNPQEDNK